MRLPSTTSSIGNVRRKTVVFAALIVWLVASAVTILFWYQLSSQREEQNRRLVNSSVQQAELRLEDFIQSRRFVLESIAETYANGRPLREENFRGTAEAVHDRFDGLLAVNWVDPESRIVWAVPLEPNRAAEGRLLSNHESAASFYRDARGSGSLRATEPLELFQGGSGVAVYIPVVRDGQHLGTVNGVFRVKSLVETALRGGLLDEYAIEIADGEQTFYRHEEFAKLADDSLAVSADVEVFDRVWTLRMVPRGSLLHSLSNSHALVLVIGLVCALLLALLVLVILGRQRQKFRSLRAIQIAETRMREAQKFEALGRLARGITHDFNNLLSAVSTGAQLIELDEDLTEDGRRNVEAILAASDRARDLTQQLMTFGRNRPGSYDSNGSIDVRQFAEKWQDFVAKLVPDKVELDIEEPPAVEICIDDSSMARILTNLVINAVDAMPEGGELRIRWDVRPNSVVMTVSDDGVGIPADVLQNIFEPYFSTKSDDEGTGLGLPTVHDLVDSAGGSIAVESTVGEGTTFRVEVRRPS